MLDNQYMILLYTHQLCCYKSHGLIYFFTNLAIPIKRQQISLTERIFGKIHFLSFLSCFCFLFLFLLSFCFLFFLKFQLTFCFTLMMEKEGIDMPASDPFNLQSLKLSLGVETNKNSVEKVKTMHEKCIECGGKLATRKDEKGLLTIYGKDGVRYARQEETRCVEKNCRTGFYFSQRVLKGGKKNYENFRLHPQRKFLVISRKTAFDIDFLYETSLTIFHHNATFLSLSEAYNDLHNTGKLSQF